MVWNQRGHPWPSARLGAWSLTVGMLAAACGGSGAGDGAGLFGGGNNNRGPAPPPPANNGPVPEPPPPANNGPVPEPPPASGALPDFQLVDTNSTSARAGQLVSPRDYLESVTGWYFTESS